MIEAWTKVKSLQQGEDYIQKVERRGRYVYAIAPGEDRRRRITRLRSRDGVFMGYELATGEWIEVSCIEEN